MQTSWKNLLKTVKHFSNSSMVSLGLFYGASKYFLRIPPSCCSKNSFVYYYKDSSRNSSTVSPGVSNSLEEVTPGILPKSTQRNTSWFLYSGILLRISSWISTRTEKGITPEIFSRILPEISSTASFYVFSKCCIENYFNQSPGRPPRPTEVFPKIPPLVHQRTVLEILINLFFNYFCRDICKNYGHH